MIDPEVAALERKRNRTMLEIVELRTQLQTDPANGAAAARLARAWTLYFDQTLGIVKLRSGEAPV